MRRLALALIFVGAAAAAKPKLTVGSKTFTESFLLAEIVAQTVEAAGEADADRRLGLGDTAIVFEGVKNGEVDLYVEYTGTLSESLLKRPSLRSVPEIREALAEQGLLIGDSLGFNNTYAIAMREKDAERLGVRTLSEAAGHPELVAGFTNAFLSREDGYPLLKKAYGMRFRDVKGLSHGLKLEALRTGSIDLTDLYSTDARIREESVRLLEDDRRAFPEYWAVILTRRDVPRRFPATWARLESLAGSIDAERMIALNAAVEIDGKDLASVAREFLGGGRSSSRAKWARFLELTREHVFLVAASLAASILVGVPLGMAASRHRPLAQVILLATGIIQTLPSLALLCFLIPIFGIGARPALFALFLYGLLPIVRSAYTGLTGIDPRLLEAARSLGLSPWQRLRLVELPLSSRHVLAGIKTSAVINVGTATLAALIGAGGYGEPIVTGLGLNDMSVVLEGAIPAAGLALVVHVAFEALDRLVIPKGLRP